MYRIILLVLWSLNTGVTATELMTLLTEKIYRISVHMYVQYFIHIYRVLSSFCINKSIFRFWKSTWNELEKVLAFRILWIISETDWHFSHCIMNLICGFLEPIYLIFSTSIKFYLMLILLETCKFYILFSFQSSHYTYNRIL